MGYKLQPFPPPIGVPPEVQACSFSDLIVRSVAVPEPEHFEYLVAMEGRCLAEIQHFLLEDKGLLVRGAITVGNIYIGSNIVFGPGLNRAYKLESTQAIHPRIIIDPKLYLELENSLEKHVDEASSKFFARGALRKVYRLDSDNIRFVDYLLQSAFEAYEYRDPGTLEIHRELIRTGLRDFSGDVAKKYKWLKSYHNKVINDMDKDFLRRLGSSKAKLRVESPI